MFAPLPAAGVVGEAMVAIVLARRRSGEVRRRLAAPSCAATGDGYLERAGAPARRPPMTPSRPRASSCWASWLGEDAGRRGARAAPGVDARRPRRARSSGAAGARVADDLPRPTARPDFRRAGGRGDTAGACRAAERRALARRRLGHHPGPLRAAPRRHPHRLAARLARRRCWRGSAPAGRGGAAPAAGTAPTRERRGSPAPARARAALPAGARPRRYGRPRPSTADRTGASNRSRGRRATPRPPAEPLTNRSCPSKKSTHLVVVESPTKARTIRGFLPDGLPGGGLHGPRPGPARVRERDPRRAEGGGVGAAGRGRGDDFQPLYVVPGPKKKVVSELKSAASRRRRADPRHRRGPRGGEHRLAPPGGARTRACPSRASSSTRSPPRRSAEALEQPARRWTRTWSGRRRPGASSTGWWATPSRRCSGRRSPRGLSAGRVQSVAVRLLVQRERERRAFRSGELLGPEGAARQGGGSRFGGAARHPGREAAGHREGLRREHGPADRGRATWCCWARRRRASSGKRLEAAAWTGGGDGGEARRCGAPRRPSPPRRCSRRRTGSCASPRATPCASRSGCTRRASSPTCGPTRSTSRSRRSPRRARGSSKLYGEDYLAPGPRQFTTKLQGRAGGPRGDPPRGHGDAHASTSSGSAGARPRSTS